jgi:hypothetical protein
MGSGHALPLGFTVLAILLTTGCEPVVKDPRLRSYVVEVNQRGQPVDPANHPQTVSTDQFDAQLDGIFAGIQAWNPPAAQRDPNGRKRIVIFVHGGLNSPADAMERAEETFQKMRDDGIYPIYINWNSDPFSTYGEHLVWVRQGRYTTTGIWSSPLYLFADFIRAFGRAPIVWTDMLGHDINRGYADISAALRENQEYRFLDNPEEKTVVRITDGMLDQQKQDAGKRTVTELSIGGYTGHTGIPIARIVSFVVFFPVKLLTAPIIDAAGRAMWQNMIRRTSVLFEGETANNLREDNLTVDKILNPSDGPLDRLIVRLHKLQNPATGEKSPYDITLIAHSAGTIVVDELIRRSNAVKLDSAGLQQDKKSVKYDNIVYMAAACSVRDFQRCVIPYLSAHREPRRVTQFYNLCLHPVNDLREEHLADAIPRGSLLVWLDDFLTEPNTPLDRTLGRWDNIVEAAYVIRDVRPQIHLKAFTFNQYGQLEDQSPQQHGDFTVVDFWKEDLWKPVTGKTMTASFHQKANELRLNAK